MTGARFTIIGKKYWNIQFTESSTLFALKWINVALKRFSFQLSDIWLRYGSPPLAARVWMRARSNSQYRIHHSFDRRSMQMTLAPSFVGCRDWNFVSLFWGNWKLAISNGKQGKAHRSRIENGSKRWAGRLRWWIKMIHSPKFCRQSFSFLCVVFLCFPFFLSISFACLLCAKVFNSQSKCNFMQLGDCHRKWWGERERAPEEERRMKKLQQNYQEEYWRYNIYTGRVHTVRKETDRTDDDRTHCEKYAV